MFRIVALAAFVAFITPCRAADAPRKIDFTVVLTDQDDRPLQECAEPDDRECKVKRPITLGSIALRALSAQEQGLSPDESLKRGALAMSVYKASAAELSADEISLIKRQIAKIASPFIVARAFPILDPSGR